MEMAKKIGFGKGLLQGLLFITLALALIAILAMLIYGLGYFLPDIKEWAGSSGLHLEGKSTVQGMFKNGIIYTSILALLGCGAYVIAYIGGYNSGLDDVIEQRHPPAEAYMPPEPMQMTEVQAELLKANNALTRVRITAKSMRERAEDNPSGIQADTLTMFAEELDMIVSSSRGQDVVKMVVR